MASRAKVGMLELTSCLFLVTLSVGPVICKGGETTFDNPETVKGETTAPKGDNSPDGLKHGWEGTMSKLEEEYTDDSYGVQELGELMLVGERIFPPTTKGGDKISLVVKFTGDIVVVKPWVISRGETGGLINKLDRFEF